MLEPHDEISWGPQLPAQQPLLPHIACHKAHDADLSGVLCGDTGLLPGLTHRPVMLMIISIMMVLLRLIPWGTATEWTAQGQLLSSAECVLHKHQALSVVC